MQPPLTKAGLIAGAGSAGAERPGAAAARLWRAVPILALICGDAIAVAAAFALAFTLRFKTELGVFYRPPDSPLGFYSSLVFLLVPLILLVFACYRLYHPGQIFDGAEEYTRIVSASTLAMMLVVLGSFLLDSALIISRGWLIISWLALVACMVAERFVARRVVYALRATGRLVKPVIVVGEGADADGLVRHINELPTIGLRVAAVLSPRLVCGGEEGEPARLRALIAETGAEAILISAASVPQVALDRIVRELTDLPAELHLVPGMHEILTTGVQSRELRGLPLVTMNKVRITGTDRALKQVVDYAVAALILAALSPLLALIALAVRASSPGPALHRRRVVGQRGTRFDALKFRTMRMDGDAILARHPELAERLVRDGKLDDDPRVTPLGRWLRRSSLDELPQLWNVLRGEMSLVGPRMISEVELAHFGPWRENLFTVKPGLTGLWQVSGRSTLGYEDRVRLDMHYIRSYTIWSDAEILLRTIPAVISGRGAR